MPGFSQNGNFFTKDTIFKKLEETDITNGRVAEVKQTQISINN